MCANSNRAAIGIETSESGLTLIFDESRRFIPWRDCSERLATASEAARRNAVLSPGGYGIHWPELDEDLSVDGLFMH
jgi:hypothetical protein